MGDLEDINEQNYTLCVDEQGNTIMDNSNVLFLRKRDQQLVYIQSEIAAKHFNLIGVNKSPAFCTEMETSDERCSRNKNDILKLIAFYGKYEDQFKSTTIRNDKVWQLIAQELGSHNSVQCKNKWKYLKSKYLEKKDYMSFNASGAKAMKFDFFEEMDAIFKYDANVVPIATASSSRGEANLSSEEVSTSVNVKKRKKSLLEKELEKFDLNMIQREKDRNDRHQEKLARQDKALQIFENMVSALVTLVKKRTEGDS